MMMNWFSSGSALSTSTLTRESSINIVNHSIQGRLQKTTASHHVIFSSFTESNPVEEICCGFSSSRPSPSLQR